jgi:H+-transporting ATPase
MIERTDGFAQVFPEHKFMIVEALKQRGWACGMTGDGVNDAPALKVANIGIAVEGATDAAQAASDIVLTEPGLHTIVTAITTARMIFQRLRNYVIYRIACTIQLLLFFFIGVVAIEVPSFSAMSPASATGAHGCDRAPLAMGACVTPCAVNPDDGTAVVPSVDGLPMPELCHAAANASCVSLPFDGSASWYDEAMIGCSAQMTLPVMALVLITILNDGTIISIAYDKVEASRRPELWRLTEVFLVSTLLGLVAVASSLVLLYLGLNANTQSERGEGGQSIFRSLGLVSATAMPFGKVQTMLYLKISLSDFLTVFSARTRGPFFSRMPGGLLLGAACFAMGVSTVLAAWWPFAVLLPLRWGEIAFVWAWCVGWFLLQDAGKVCIYHVIHLLTPRMINLLRWCDHRCHGGGAAAASSSRCNRESLLRDIVQSKSPTDADISS